MSNSAPLPEHPAFIVRYKLDDLFYFCHAKSWSSARWQIVRRHKRRYGFSGLVVQRFHVLDNVPITRLVLDYLGYTQARGDQDGIICGCTLCAGGPGNDKTRKKD